ncbi:MAG TPA: glycogen debranching protein GlgX [Spirochaetota bacterium]|jgi:glycogen operon protein|nr:glycogen debranching protein GlgX [Spirochaetota bacterium]HOQ11316.1 glycogen debranching protein GlgX [Spirochaetota bacterium]HOV07764.1 glycogen debranching protein GlgX [Spirochaetota bacterium]
MIDYKNLKTAPGLPTPLGAYVHNNGVQFSIFSRNASGVKLILFHNSEPDSDFTEIALDPFLNKTGDVWHIWIEGLSEGQVYGYRISGEYDPANGHRFNENKLLIDPYSRAITGNFIWDLSKACGIELNVSNEAESFSTVDSGPYVPRSIVINGRNEIVKSPIRIPENDLIIYELHVKGFTAHHSSKVNFPGTFKGLTEKIPYLKELGINAVELLPIQEFDEYENININPFTGERLKNYWGYSTIAFFAPKGSYSSSGTLGQQVKEFREMVRAFNDAGIEVFLDVVFNHTHEGDHRGPTLSFRGIDNSIYYILDEDKRFYKNFSGCGNTVNCNHPLVRQFILDALRYWFIEMDVDGFRFDLASILGRDQKGEILSNPPLIEWIEEDPILRNAKIIAEAWDAGGAYLVGKFPGRWAEWNGRYRDDVRRFWRGEKGLKGAFATRITGSSDLYSTTSPCRSINFITCHDGFTLNDLVSYNNKHNLENGEDNRDGENHNFSCNWGEEGPTNNPEIEKIRKRMIKNFIATLFISLGVPMLLSGDEFRRTQKGNNNSYCQDNEISWINWDLLQENSDIFEFTKSMILFRKEHPMLRSIRFYTGEQGVKFTTEDIQWKTPENTTPDWDDEELCIAALINGAYAEEIFLIPDSDFYMMFNPSNTDIVFSLPQSPSGRRWKLSINTAAQRGMDIYLKDEPIIEREKITVEAHSMIILTA